MNKLLKQIIWCVVWGLHQSTEGLDPGEDKRRAGWDISWKDRSWTDISWTDISWTDISWTDISWIFSKVESQGESQKAYNLIICRETKIYLRWVAIYAHLSPILPLVS